MSIANRLYDRPHGSNLSPVNEAALYVDGSFPSAAANLAYIGRLQIHNAIGACKVKLLSSDPALPKGYTLGVDNTTHEVVLKWPAYQSGTVAIPNANFELGDDGSWDLGPGWSIMSGVTAPDPNDAGSSWQAQYANQGGNSLLIHRMAADVSPGQSITCSCDVQQGASSSASAGAAVRLRFTDDAGTIIQEFDGAAVMSGSNSEWHTSSLSANVPGGATKVHIGADAVRNRENKPLWVDNFQWNLTQEALGTNEAHTITLSLRVTDTSGRTADWSGSIDVGGVAATWDPTRIMSGDYAVVLGNGNRTATQVTAAGVSKEVHGTTVRTSGKFYYEVAFTRTGGTSGTVFNAAAGVEWEDPNSPYIANTGGAGSSAFGWSNNSVIGKDGAYVSFSEGFVSGDVLMIAADLDGGKVWFGKNGTWVGDPGAGTGAAFTDIKSGTGTEFAPQASIYGAQAPYVPYALTANFAPADFAYVPPPGFTYWAQP